MYTTIDFSALKDKLINLRVDVGPSSQFTEAMAVSTLDKLLAAGRISLVQYLERMPEGYIPAQQPLIEDARAAQNIRAAQMKGELNENE